MQQIKLLINWLNTNSKYGFPLIRIFLGLALLIRGFVLFVNPESITQLEGANQYYWSFSYVIIMHIVGGLFLTIGFWTRLASFLQIPVLFGAVFFVHLQQGLVKVEQSFELSVLVLVLLIIFFLFGGGALSIDNYIDNKNVLKSKS